MYMYICLLIDGWMDGWIIIIIINLFIVDKENTIKSIFLSTNVALKTWLI